MRDRPHLIGEGPHPIGEGSHPVPGGPHSGRARRYPVSVVVPARDAERWIRSCLEAIRAAGPAEVIVVDGASSDATRAISAELADRVVDDDGAGVAAARQIGLTLARQPWVMFVDTDVLLRPDTIGRLLDEVRARGLEGIQAGLASVGEGDYWSEALAEHHNRGRVRGWFGVCATLVRRDLLVRRPLDATFRSGEDVDLRLRLEAAGEPIGVSGEAIVEHRFAPGWEYARGQFLADGAGLGRLLRRHGPAALGRAFLPFGAAALGLIRVFGGEVRQLPYWLALGAYNLVGLLEGLLDDRVARNSRASRDSRDSRDSRPADAPRPPVAATPMRAGRGARGSVPGGVVGERADRAEAGEVSVPMALGTLGVGLTGALVGIVLVTSGILPDLGHWLDRSALPGLLTLAVGGGLVIAELSGATGDRRSPGVGTLISVTFAAAAVAVALAGIRLAYVVGLLA